MTLQSCPNSSEEVAPSPSCSTSTSSTDVYPLPYSIGDKEIVLNNDERSVVSVVTDNEFLGRGTTTNISVENSTNVDVGNRTVFNGDVTIYQHINGHLPEIQNGPIEHGVDCNKNVRVATSTSDQPGSKWGKRTFVFCAAIAAMLLVTVVATTVTVVYNNRSHSSSSAVPSTTPSCTTVTEPHSDDNNFISRDKWYGKDPINVTKIDSATLVVVKHTGGSMCDKTEACKQRVRDIQKEDMEVHHMADIRYNFLVGGDGKIYTGRGWHVKNEGRNDSLDIAFVGNFSIDIPTQAMLNLGQQIIIKGGILHAVDFAHYRVVNHNQTEKTDSPGKNLFTPVTKWMFYSPKIYYNCSNSSGGDSGFIKVF